MKLSARDIRALILLAVGVIAIIIYRTVDFTPKVVDAAESPAVLEANLARVRRVAASVPARAEALKSAESDLHTREKNMLAFATAPQAQAHLLEVARRVALGDKIDVRGGDFTAPALLGADYGQVAVSVSFESTIDAFVNLLADLSREPELISPSEIHISAGNPKNKTINVRMTLAGVVARKLVPEKKGGLSL